jgi:hypothetical protein
MSQSVSRVKLVVVLVLVFALGAGAGAYGGYRYYQIEQMQNGPAVEARPIAWTKRSARKSAVYSVSYKFDANGVTHTGGGVAVPKDVYDGAQKAHAITVRHAPERPDWHLPEAALESEKESAARIALSGLFTCAFIALASALAWFSGRRQAQTAAQPAPLAADNFPKDPPTGST